MTETTKYRREFHKYPETAWTEIRTSARIAEILTSFGIDDILMGDEVVNVATLEKSEVIDLTEETRKNNIERAVKQGADPGFAKRTKGYPGVIASFDTGKPGPVYALRFDIDALPYDEFRGEGYRPYDEGYISVNSEHVHACGHDGHTSIGLALAHRIHDHIRDYKGKIKLIFQPAEETVLGAQSIVDKGHLDGVDHFLAVHLALSAENQPLPSHTIACGCKDFLSNRELEVTFHGRAAHPCGASQEGRNALLAACSAALNLHNIAPHEKGLTRVNVGKITGGACANTIPSECTINLEYRGQFAEISEYLRGRVKQVLDGAAMMYGADYTVVDYGEVPAGQSSDEMMDLVKTAAEHEPWFEKIFYEGNIGGTDDAAVMMNYVQEHGGIGAYAGIGTDVTGPLHNPKFDFDEDCLDAAVNMISYVLKNS